MQLVCNDTNGTSECVVAATVEPVFNLHDAECTQRLNDTPSVIGGFQGVMTILINCILFFFILTRQQLREKHSNKFFLNLQLVNILISFSVLVGILITDNLTEMIINNGLLMTKFLCLVIKTIDRFAAIAYPYKYEKLTKDITLVIIGGTWFPAFIFITTGLLIGITRDGLIIISVVFFLLATVILIFANFRIYLIARQHHTRLKKNQNKMVLKSTYICIGIVISFVLLWFPFLVHNIMVLLGHYTPKCNKIFTIVSVQLGLLHCLVEPFLYICFHKDAKVELKNSIRKSTGSLMVDDKFRNSSQCSSKARNVLEINDGDKNLLEKRDSGK